MKHWTLKYQNSGKVISWRLSKKLYEISQYNKHYWYDDFEYEPKPCRQWPDDLCLWTDYRMSELVHQDFIISYDIPYSHYRHAFSKRFENFMGW